MSDLLDSIFQVVNECKENECKINKKDIQKIYKPDLGILDKKLKKELFGNVKQVSLCDCVIIKKNNHILLLEIKCGTVTNSILKETITQISNVYKILENKNIKVNQCTLICKKFSDVMLKKSILTKRINGIPLTNKTFKNTALEI